MTQGMAPKAVEMAVMLQVFKHSEFGVETRMLKHHAGGAPKFGPKQRILPMHAW